MIDDSRPPETERRPCPFCAEAILPAAIVCRFCGRTLPTDWARLSSDSQARPASPTHATETRAPPNKPRRAWIAGILSFLAPGVGQVYNGAHVEGLTLFSLFIAFVITENIALPRYSSNTRTVILISAALAEVAIRIGAGIVAFRRARRVRTVQVRPYQRGWIYVSLVLVIPVINAIGGLGPLGFSLSLPSGAMMPTLLVGDRVHFGYYREEFPDRGDVAVFRLPTDLSTVYIDRIVGLPGDRVQVRHGELYINDTLVPRRQTQDYLYQEGDTSMPLHQYIESLPRADGGPVEHVIIKVGDDGPLDNTPVYEVPPGHFFAMGDNRDNSQDSRILSAVGFIPAENMLGRAEMIVFSNDGSARWWQVWKWPSAIRYSRLFRTVS